MARLPRYVVPGQPQHIIQRGNNRQDIFAAEEDYWFFRDALIESSRKYELEVHAYVWMTNHIHLLASPLRENSIGKVFQAVGHRYVQYFNRTYQRTGTLWEGRYRATVVDSERYLLTVMRYIELNPVRAEMVDHPREYPWSSFRRNALGDQGSDSKWLVAHDVYRRLGPTEKNRQSAYRQLFRGAISAADLSEIRDCTHKGWALGSNKFRARIEKLSGRQATSKGMGRPKMSSDAN